MPIYKKWGHFVNLMILLISPQFDRAMAVVAATALWGLSFALSKGDTGKK
jgi:hypothetical protein